MRLTFVGLILMALLFSIGAKAQEPAMSLIVYTASDGYTPEAASLTTLMTAEGAQFFAFGGDATFTDQHPEECPTWPSLQFYCAPTILTDAQVQAGWQFIRWSLLQLDRAISYGNHETAAKGGLDPFVASQFGNQPFYVSRLFTVPGGRALLIFLTGSLSLDPGTPQRLWLESTLAANPTADWKLVFLHQMLYSAVKPSLPLRQLTPLFDAYQIDLIVSGHVLWYERTHQYVSQAPGYPLCADGICVTDNSPSGTYLKGVGRINVNPGCGGMRCFGTTTNPLPPMKTVPPYTAKWIGVRHHYATITWSPDGRFLTVRTKDQTGILDEFTILR